MEEEEEEEEGLLEEEEEEEAGALEEEEEEEASLREEDRWDLSAWGNEVVVCDEWMWWTGRRHRELHPRVKGCVHAWCTEMQRWIQK